MDRTYAISLDPGYVHRLDNLSGSWTDVSLPSTFTGELEDVKTGPILPDRVMLAGGIAPAFGWHGLYLSNNAGVTWTSPTGNFQTAAVKLWYQLSWPDTNNVFACADGGNIAHSSDGGATFTLTTGYPTPSGFLETGAAQCLHFISGTTGVVGFNGSVFKTTDAGATWTYLNGASPLTIPKVVTNLYGIHMDVTEQVITALGREAIYRSTDGGLTFTLVYDFTNNEGRHLTWTDDTTLWGIGNRGLRLKSSNSGATWTVLNPYSAVTGPIELGGHFYSGTNGFYGNDSTVMFTVDQGVTGSVSDTLPAVVKTIWTILDPAVCYQITRCDDPTISLTVGDDLSSYVGQIIQLSNKTCWTVVGTCKCINPVSVIISDSFSTCDECTNPPVTCYILTDCDQTASPIETKEVSTDLSAYVGMTVQIVGSDKCWTVTSSTGCSCPVEVVVSYSAASCDLCPAPIPVRPRSRRVAPGNPPACDLNLLTEVNKTFAEAWYKEVLSMRFGINVCCEYDLDMAFVKREVVHLQMLYDPQVCCPTTSSPYTCS